MDFEVFCFGCWVWVFFWGGSGSGPRFLLCLLPERSVVCVESGHPAPPSWILPPAARGPAVCRRGVGRASEGEKQQSPWWWAGRQQAREDGR